MLQLCNIHLEYFQNVEAERAGNSESMWRKLVRRMLYYYIAAMVAAVVVVFIFLLEPLRLTVEEVPVEMRGWAGDATAARVAVLTDLHAGMHDATRLDCIVQRTLDEKPEAVLLAGDYFSALKPGKAMSAKQIAAHLAPLAKQCPVYYVFGNHDMSPAGRRLRQEFKDKGFVCVENAEHLLTFANGQKLKLRGLPYTRELSADRKTHAAQWLERRFSYDKLPPDMPLLVLTHSPYYFLNHSLCVDLAVAGHTHGGQVCAPNGMPLTADAPWTRETARAGLKRGKSGCLVYTSRGLGLSRLPVRAGCPPEITVLELKPAKK